MTEIISWVHPTDTKPVVTYLSQMGSAVFHEPPSLRLASDRAHTGHVNPAVDLPADCLDRLEALLADGRRKLLGLVGPPGAGKSTLAQRIAQTLGQRAQVVPMDGFHLAQAELARLGRAARKGAPDTFDSAGYVALLRRLREQRGDEIVYAPAFRRELEEPIAGAIALLPQTRLVITEGNYLLFDEGPWADVAPLLDATWYVEADDTLRRARLVRRHQQFGRSPEAARAWEAATDQPNARRIAATRARAQLVLQWNG